MARLILIEDDDLLRSLIGRKLSAAGHEVIALADGRDLFDLMDRIHVHAVLVDLGLPYLDGMSLIEGLRARGHEQPVIALSGRGEEHLREAVRGSGADHFFAKPFDTSDLVHEVQRLLAA
jgi:DNA-binding response OmpR family regulator